jgi:hypothetical protein
VLFSSLFLRDYYDCKEKKPSDFAEHDSDVKKQWELSAELTGCKDMDI